MNCKDKLTSIKNKGTLTNLLIVETGCIVHGTFLNDHHSFSVYLKLFQNTFIFQSILITECLGAPLLFYTQGECLACFP